MNPEPLQPEAHGPLANLERKDRDERIKAFLLTLARRTQTNEKAAQTIAMILADRIADYWQPALEASMQAAESLGGDEEIYPVIDTVIAKSIREKPDLNLAAELYNRIPTDTVLLKQTALEIFRQTVKAMKERNRVELYPAEYIAMVLNLVARLTQTGESVEAEMYANEALELSRSHHTSEPEKFHDALCSSLETTALVASGLGQREKSREARTEAINLMRGVPGQERNLAQSLNNLAGTLKDLGELDSALEASREAVAIYRTLVPKEPRETSTNYQEGLQAWIDDPRPQFGEALVGLSSHQNDCKLHQESLASAKEAYELFRGLSGDYPDQFRYHFGMALHNLGMADFGVEDLDSGLKHMRESAKVLAALVPANSEAYLPTYAHVLSSLTLAFAKHERNREAIEPARECVDAYTRLNQLAPSLFKEQLTRNLENLKVLYDAEGMTDLATETADRIKGL